MKNKRRLVFMGTPEIAEKVLAHVLAHHGDAWELVGVFTQPDKPVGRRQVLTPPQVKTLALAQGIPVFQPRRIKARRWGETLHALSPELVLVLAYGQILSKELLDIPALGCVNVHTSLLPKYRGAAPIQWAMALGEKESGVTLMQMDEGMDTGPILLQQRVTIGEADTIDAFYDGLIQASYELVDQYLSGLARGESFPAHPQKEEEASYAPMLQKADGKIDWQLSCRDIDCRIRGFAGWPGSFTYYQDKTLRILKARPWRMEEADSAPGGGNAPQTAQASQTVPSALTPQSPGTWEAALLSEKRPRLAVWCGAGLLEVLEVQPEGKKPMQAEDFLRGILFGDKPRRF